MAAAGVKIEQREFKTGMLDAALTDMAERLREMVRRETKKEVELVNKSLEIEVEVEITEADKVAIIQVTRTAFLNR